METQIGKPCCLFLSKFCGPNVQYHFCPETPLNVTHGHLTPSPIPPKPPPFLLQVLQGEGGRTAPLRKARNLPEQSPVYSPLGNPQRGRWEGEGVGRGRGGRAGASSSEAGSGPGSSVRNGAGAGVLWLVILVSVHARWRRGTAGARGRPHTGWCSRRGTEAASPSPGLRQPLSSTVPGLFGEPAQGGRGGQRRQAGRGDADTAREEKSLPQRVAGRSPTPHPVLGDITQSWPIIAQGSAQ